MDRRPLAIAAGALLVVACLCVCLASVAIITLRRGDNLERALAPLGDLCGGVGGGVAAAAVYSNAPRLHPVAIFVADAQGAYRLNPAGFNSNWQAQSVAEAELVICIDEVRETVIERCDYALTDGATGVVERIGVDVRFRVLAAHSGRELLRNSGIGLPRECADEETFSDDLRQQTLRGHLVDAVAPAVAPLVAPVAP